MDISLMSEVLQDPYKLFKADSGAITFRLITRHTEYWGGQISLIGKECPHEVFYQMALDFESSYISFKKDGQEVISSDIPSSMAEIYWLTWYNNTIQIGEVEPLKHLKPFFVYEDKTAVWNPRRIGFIRVTANQFRDFIVESSPILRHISYKKIQGGQLRWVRMMDDKLPHDALIGGYESEPIYIARALHGNSMCPGKYVPSKKKAFVPWGRNEYEKKVFEVLCGYDAFWVKCKEDYIPKNVFKAGTSEVNTEDIYIGRAMVGDDLIIGKVHMLYKTCYLPYKGKELERYEYEILVRGDITANGETTVRNCLLNPMKALQPCI